jgi:hypothetical protein
MRTLPIAELSKHSLNPKKRSYPQSRCKDLPRDFFVGLFVGSRNTGKTYSAVDLLKLYEHYPIYDAAGLEVDQRVILVSGSYEANAHYWDELKSHFDPEVDLHAEYSDVVLAKILEDIKEEKYATDEYKLQLKVWRKYQRSPGSLTPDDVADLQLMNYRAPKEPTYPNGVVNFLVVDDMVGCDIFRQGRNPFITFLVKNRHFATNVLIMTQSLKAVPKTIRINTSLFVLFKNQNARVVAEDIYEEISSTFSIDQFLAVFHFATSEQHGSLVLDFTDTKLGCQARRGWRDTIVFTPEGLKDVQM